MKNIFNIIYYFVVCHFFPKLLKKGAYGKEFTMGFILKNNRWYADIPLWKGAFDQLEMVAGSADMLDVMSKGQDKVTFKVSLSPFEGCFKLEKIKQTNMGATYQVYDNPEYNKTIWLCNVTRFVFGEHPQYLYFKMMK